MSSTSVHDSKCLVYVNSAKRISGTDSSFQIQLQFNTRKKYNRAALVSANIPKTYYAIVSPKNTFILLENSTQITITVTPGTYNRNAFAYYLASLLTSCSLNNWTYTINIPNTNTGPETGYYYFAVIGNGASQPAFIFNEVGLCQQLGFDSNSTNTFVGNVLTSVNVTNLAAETSLYLHSDIVNDLNSENNILQDIYTNGYSYNSYIAYQNPNVEFNSKPFVDKGNIWSFWLTDENENVLNLNGSNMVLTICLFREPLVFRMIENYIIWKIHKNSAENKEVDLEEDPTENQ